MKPFDRAAVCRRPAVVDLTIWERAIASVPEEQRSEPAVAGLLTGVEATRRTLLAPSPRHGLKRFEPIGEPFDPHRHEASFEAVDARYPPEP